MQNYKQITDTNKEVSAMKNTRVALVGLTSTNTEKYIMTGRCGKFQTVIINPAWTNVMDKRLAAESFHKDWTSFTIYNNKLVRITNIIIKTLRCEKAFQRYEVERAREIDTWMSEFKKVAEDVYDLYKSNRDTAIAVMKEAVKGYNVESTTTEPILKRNVWIAPADSKYFDLQITKGECFEHPEERIKYVTREADLDIIKNFVQVRYYNLLDVKEAKLESEMDRYIKATAEEIADINPDWIGHESFEENLVSLMDIKNRVGEEVYQRALEVAF